MPPSVLTQRTSQLASTSLPYEKPAAVARSAGETAMGTCITDCVASVRLLELVELVGAVAHATPAAVGRHDLTAVQYRE